MNTQAGANGVATFLMLTRPINFSPLHIAAAVPNIPLGPVIANRNFQRAAFSTGLIGTGLALSAFYTGILNGGRHARHANNTFTPVQWLEYPADYVSPMMDLFADGRVPLDDSSPLSCPKDSEHLERAFDLLKYRYLSKRLGVPSVVNQDTTFVVRLLRILGNTSSGSSSDFLSAAKLLSALDASSTQTRPQKTNGGEKNGNDESRSLHPKTSPLPGTQHSPLYPTRNPNQSHTLTGLVSARSLPLLSLGYLQSPSLFRQPRHYPNRPQRLTTFRKFRKLILTVATATVLLSLSMTNCLLNWLLAFLSTPTDLFGDDSLVDPYTTDVGSLEDGPAPDVFAALFDALQDALPSFQELNFLPYLARCFLLWREITACLSLHVLAFFVTGRFCRGIQQLMKELKDVKASDNEGGSGIVTINAIGEDYGRQGYIAAWIAMSQPPTSPSTSDPPVDQTVETLLSPVVDVDDPAVEEDEGWTVVNRRRSRGRKRPLNITAAEDDAQTNDNKVAEPFASWRTSRLEQPRDPFVTRLRGHRGHGRGRGHRPAVVAGA